MLGGETRTRDVDQPDLQLLVQLNEMSLILNDEDEEDEGTTCWEQIKPARRAASEARRRQDVHVSGLQLVRPRPLTAPLHRGDLHLGRRCSLSGGVFGQSRGLGLHHLHGGGLLGAAVRLQRKACWEKRKKCQINEDR